MWCMLPKRCHVMLCTSPIMSKSSSPVNASGHQPLRTCTGWKSCLFTSAWFHSFVIYKADGELFCSLRIKYQTWTPVSLSQRTVDLYCLTDTVELTTKLYYWAPVLKLLPNPHNILIHIEVEAYLTADGYVIWDRACQIRARTNGRPITSYRIRS